MNIRNTIIEHYKKFFDLHAKGIALDEDDHLNIDWAEDLVKNCFIPNVVEQGEQLVAFCRWYNQVIPSYETTEEEIVETYLRESN